MKAKKRSVSNAVDSSGNERRKTPHGDAKRAKTVRGEPSEANDVQQLAQALAADPIRNVRAVKRLLGFLKAETPAEQAAQATLALRVYFLGALERGHLKIKRAEQASDQDPEAVLAEWVRSQHSAFRARCLDLVASGGPDRLPVQLAAMGALMELVRSEEVGQFGNTLFVAMIRRMAASPDLSGELLGSFAERYAELADVRYYTLRAVQDVAEDLADGGKEVVLPAEMDRSEVTSNLFDILKCDAGPMLRSGEAASWCGAIEAGAVRPAVADDRAARKQAGKGAGDDATRAAKWASHGSHVRAFSGAWLALLRAPMPADIYCNVLAALHEAVIPAMANPLLLSDFLTRSLDRGGITGMLALQGIFVLVTQHGLEYPKFYEKLYQLIQPSSLALRQRGQFFRLADMFLNSPMVPAYSAASFAKKFARMALAAPPHGAMLCLAFVNNIVRRHPSLVALQHRAAPPAGGNAGPPWNGTDPFDPDATDPAEAGGVSSTLWEVEALQQHWLPQVAHMARQVMGKDLEDRRRASEIDVAPLAAASFAGLFQGEVGRKLRRAVPVAYYGQDDPPGLHGGAAPADFAAFDFQSA
ncbi:unnamed protein product [Pedinophyceae sp. YPF-701]|nr:unnamed protein product [Pedinophyceae sp. YPF-701]